MPDITCIPINDNGFSENLLKKSASFQNGIDYSVTSGAGTVTLEEFDLNTSKPTVLKGIASLRVYNADYQDTDLLYSSPSGLDSFITSTPENYFISLYVNNISGTINTNLKLEIFADAFLTYTFLFPLNSTTLPAVNDWQRIGQNVFFDSGFIYTMRWTLEKEPANASTTKTILIDGLSVQCLNQNTLSAPIYREPKDIIVQKIEAIDLPLIANGANLTTTVKLTGSQVGDYVQMTYPASLINSGLSVGVPLVTATDTVKFIVTNNSGGAVDASSGDFTFKIVK